MRFLLPTSRASSLIPWFHDCSSPAYGPGPIELLRDLRLRQTGVLLRDSDLPDKRIALPLASPIGLQHAEDTTKMSHSGIETLDSEHDENASTKVNGSFTPVDTLPKGFFRFIALDVETSCGDSASICQIGLACVGADNHIWTFATYINPEMGFDAFNIQLHGIDENTVSEAPTFAEFWHQLLPLLETNYLVQHSNFDKTAIEAACKAAELRSPDLNWSNSISIAKTAWPEFKGNGGYGLAHLKTELALEFQHHDAGEDARAAALVVLHAERHLKKNFETFVGAPRQIQLVLPF